MKLVILCCLLASAYRVYGADPCGPRNPCLNSGTCSATGRDYKCQCLTGWTGRQCSVPQQRRKECNDKSEHCSYWASTNQCELNSGYMKENCCASCKNKGGSKNACSPNPCQFMDTVEQQSVESGECSVVGGSFNCTCKPSYEGDTCEKIRPIEMFAGPGMEHLLSVKMSVENFKVKFSGGSDDSGNAKFKSYRKDRHGPTDQIGCGRVTAVPSDLTFITRYRHYRKYTHAYGIPIVSTNAVSDKALDRACYVLRFLLADHPRTRKYLFYNWGRVGIMGRREGTTSIPEHRHLGKWWDTRARGLGGTLAIPISTGAEENLLCERGDRYPREDIFLHEFCHGIQEVGIRGGGIPGYFGRLQRQYNYARSRGLWRNTYAMSTVQEYFAEGVQSYFHTNDYSPTPNGVHGPVNTRAKLKRYDPALYNLIHEVFPCENWITTNCQEAKGMARKMPKPGCGGLTPPKPKTPAPPKTTQGPPPTPEFTDPPTGAPPPKPKSPPLPKPKSPPPPKPKTPPPPKPKTPPPPKPKTPPPPKPKTPPPPKPKTPPPPKPKTPPPKPNTPSPPTTSLPPKPNTTPQPTTKPKPPTKKGCDKDEEADCPAWAGMGYCLKSSLHGRDYHPFMHDKCRKSCGCCDDKSSVCKKYKSYCGERMSYYMERLCKKTCSYCDW